MNPASRDAVRTLDEIVICDMGGVRIHNGNAGSTGDSLFLAQLYFKRGFFASHNTDDTQRFAEFVYTNKEKIKYVTIAGGDGTLQVVLTELFQAFGDEKIPDIYILPCGSENKVAMELDYKRGDSAHWDSLVFSRESLLVSKINVTPMKLEVDDSRQLAPMYYFDFGFGAVAKYLAKLYDVTIDDAQPNGIIPKKMSSTWRRKLAVTRQTWHDAKTNTGIMAPIEIEELVVELKDGSTKRYSNAKSTAGMVSTMRDLMYDLHLFYKAQYGGLAHALFSESEEASLYSRRYAILASRLTESSFLPFMPDSFPLGEGFFDDLVKSIEITFKRPEIVQMAGELIKGTKIKLTAMPEKAVTIFSYQPLPQLYNRTIPEQRHKYAR